jgi:hypothetical protein
MTDPIQTPAQGETPAADHGPQNQGQSPVADAAAQAAQAQAEAKESMWYSGLPETTHEKLKDFKSPDDAISAMEAGKQFVQAKSIDDYKFELGEDVEVAPQVVGFKKFCLEEKIAPSQAQKLLGFQEKILADANEVARVEGETALRKEWGNGFDNNIKKAFSALAAIDRNLGGTQLSAELKRIGGGNNPAVIKALLFVADKIGEDSLGAGGPGGAPEKSMTTEEAYSALFGKK